MTPNEPLLLYSRADCHLCELAARMLERLGIAWRELDIDDDPALAERYALRVPVLRRSDSGRELDYPFDEAGLRRFIDAL
jgi:hypothetical protein